MIKSLEWSLWIYDIAYYVLMLFCLRHALKQEAHLVIILITAVVFGFFVEHGAVVTIPQPYHYNFFFIKLPGPVPLGAVLGWGIIVYTCFIVARSSGIVWYMQPVYMGLLATMVDFVLDPIVVYVGMWTWTYTNETQWFGIPWSNYDGWIIIVASFGFFQMLGYRIVKPGSKGIWGDIGVSAIAMLPAYLTTLAWIKGYLWLVKNNIVSEQVLIGLIFTFVGLLVIAFVPKMKRDNEPVMLVYYVLGFFLGWCLVMLYVSDLHIKYPELVIVYPAYILIVLLAFSWPFLDKLLEKKE